MESSQGPGKEGACRDSGLCSCAFMVLSAYLQTNGKHTTLRRNPEVNIRRSTETLIKSNTFDTKITLILIFSVDSQSDCGVRIRNQSKRGLDLRNLELLAFIA